MTPYVLVVDDDATQRKLMKLRLVDAGYAVATASGADEALQIARARVPDAILSDVLMPDLDGFTLCRMVREDARLRAVPVILLSAHYQSAPDQHLAAKVGASALIARTPELDVELAALRGSLAGAVPACVPEHEVYEEQMRSNATQVSRLLGKARGAEERYRTLFANATDAIAVLNRDGVFLEANARWGAVLGVDPAQLIGRHFREFSPPESVAHNAALFAHALAHGAGRLDSVAVQRLDGTTIFMEFSFAVAELEGEQVVLGIGHEVTQQVIAAEALVAAERQYRTLLERIPDVIWTARCDGSLTFATANVEAMLGDTVEQFCDQRFDERLRRVYPEDREALSAAWRRLIDLGTPVDIEYRRQHRNGTWVWVRCRMVAGRTPDGELRVEGMMSDITERRRIEDTLVQAQRMEAIGQLSGGIAHDFNNILAAILANSHFLSEDLGEHDPRRQLADEIRIAAERAAGLTRQLLAFSRKQVLEPCVVDLNSVVVGLEKMLRRLIGEQVELGTDLCPGPGTTRVDIGQLEQVILNLVVNARDAMPAGGAVRIETRNITLATAAAAELGAPVGRYVVLAVADTGVGMDLETQRRIFEPFFTTKGPGKGTGLGLSTCYGIVQQSGGYIAVHSEPGLGTRFEIYLPRVDERRDLRRPTGIQYLDRQGTETILLIEDDERVRRAIQRMLEPRGYRLLVARNGAEALAIGEANLDQIALVLSDVVMPGLSGPDVVDQLGEVGCAPRVLFMSGYTSHDLLERTELHARRNFIAKPFSVQALLKKVREVLDATAEGE